MTQYIKLGITERNGDVESETLMVAEVPEDTSTDHLNRATRELLKDWYGSCDDDWDNFDTDFNGEAYKIWSPHDTLCWVSSDEQITEHEFNILKKHLINMTFNVTACLTKTA